MDIFCASLCLSWGQCAAVSASLDPSTVFELMHCFPQSQRAAFLHLLHVGSVFPNSSVLFRFHGRTCFLQTYHHSQPVQDSGPRPHIIETRVSFMRVLCLKANAPYYFLLFRFDLKGQHLDHCGRKQLQRLGISWILQVMLSDLSLSSESQCQSL